MTLTSDALRDLAKRAGLALPQWYPSDMILATLYKNIRGKLAKCSCGRYGRITGIEPLSWGWAFVGDGLDGRPWSSQNPNFNVVEAGPGLREDEQGEGVPVLL